MGKYKTFNSMQTPVTPIANLPGFSNNSFTESFGLPSIPGMPQMSQMSQAYPQSSFTQDPGPDVSRAIRNYNRTPVSEIYNPSAGVANLAAQPYPQSSTNIGMYGPNSNFNYPNQQSMTPNVSSHLLEFPRKKDTICTKVQRHLKKCSHCKKKYSHNNLYITIIMGLALFIMFLFTKIIDKFSK